MTFPLELGEYLFCTFFYFAFLICVYSQSIYLANVFSHMVVVFPAPLCPDNYMFILMKSSSIDYFRVE